MASTPTRGKVHVTDRGFRKCDSQKVGYASQAAAFDAAEATMLIGRVSPGCHLMPYLCPDCAEWHIANKQIVPVPGQVRRKKAKRRVVYG